MNDIITRGMTTNHLSEFQTVYSGLIKGVPAAVLEHTHDPFSPEPKKDYTLYLNYDRNNPVLVGVSEEELRKYIDGMRNNNV